MGKKRDDGGEWLTDKDLLTEVLSRLSVKYLLQCKAVSKTWYSLISSPSFIKSHHQRAITSNTAGDEKGDILIVRHVRGILDLEVFPEEDGSYSLFQLDGTNDFLAHLKFPFEKAAYRCMPPQSLLVGCVYGIVCVCVDPLDDLCYWPNPDKSTDIYIWNPATKQSKLVPSHTPCCGERSTKVTLGFGFDPIDFDFKVVRVVSRAVLSEVYSANRDVWRNIETKLLDVPYENKFDMCLHGFLFATGNNGMIAFDLNKEVFICDIKLPVSDARRWNDPLIVDFKDSIAVIIEGSKNINLWTLDDEACLYGGRIKASWTFMISIDDIGVPFFSFSSFFSFHGLFNSVEFLLARDDDRFLYNSNKKVGREFSTYPVFECYEVFKYTESLVSIAGSKLVNWSDSEDDNEQSSDGSEDDNEQSNIDIEHENDKNPADSENNEQGNIIPEDDNGQVA